MSRKKFDAITIDLLLPDMNGWEVLRAFRSRGPNLETPAIVVTVVGSKPKSFGFMIQNILIKPIKAEDLTGALKRTGVFPNQNKSILFLDDDPQMLIVYKKHLKNYASTILFENTVEKALALANLKCPDVVVLDLNIPEIDGLEFLRRFRLTENGKKTPVIICTSQDIREEDRARIKDSVIAVVQKGEDSMINLIEEMKNICPLKTKINP